MAESERRRYGFREDVLNILLKILEPFEDVTPDNMFGFPSFRASGRIFACVYESGISLKMPSDAAEKIVSAPGITPFIPFGRARMRQWIHIERKKADAFIDDFHIIEASIHYVRTLPLPPGTRKGAKKAAGASTKPAVAQPQPAKAKAAPAAKPAAKKAAPAKVKPEVKKAGGKQPAAKKATAKKATATKSSAKKPSAKKAPGKAAKTKAPARRKTKPRR
jgi:hypothetical protein